MNPEVLGLISLIIVGGVIALTFLYLNIFAPPPRLPAEIEDQSENEDSVNSY